MSDPLPTVAITPSPVNDLVLTMSALLPTRDLSEIFVDPDTVYRRYRAEIKLVSDLVFPPSEAPGAPADDGGERDRERAAFEAFAAGSLLR